MSIRCSCFKSSCSKGRPRALVGKIKMKIVAIIQARMGSTRLPCKVLLDLEGASVLARVLARVKRAATIGEVVVATSDGPGDEAIATECTRLPPIRVRGHGIRDLTRS